MERFEQLLMRTTTEPKVEQYLINGFRFNFTGKLLHLSPLFLKSARQSPDILFSKLSKEHDAGRIGRIAGSRLFYTATSPSFRTSLV